MACDVGIVCATVHSWLRCLCIIFCLPLITCLNLTATAVSFLIWYLLTNASVSDCSSCGYIRCLYVSPLMIYAPIDDTILWPVHIAAFTYDNDRVTWSEAVWCLYCHCLLLTFNAWLWKPTVKYDRLSTAMSKCRYIHLLYIQMLPISHTVACNPIHYLVHIRRTVCCIFIYLMMSGIRCYCNGGGGPLYLCWRGILYILICGCDMTRLYHLFLHCRDTAKPAVAVTLMTPWCIY